MYLSELGSLVSGKGDNQVISSTCCVKIITAQGATTQHLTNNSQIVRRGGKTDSDNNQIKKIQKSITNKKRKVHFIMCVESKK